MIDSYKDTYTTLKKPRKLYPVQSIGQVEIELDFSDGSTRLFVVNPIQANIIMHFQISDDSSNSQDKATQSLQKLSSLCEMDESDVLSALMYWVNKSVIRECTISNSNSSNYNSSSDREFEIIEEQASYIAQDLAGDNTDDMDMVRTISVYFYITTVSLTVFTNS